METTVGKKKFAVAKKKVAVAKKNFTPLLHKGVKSFFGAQRNAFSLTSSTCKKLNNDERSVTKIILDRVFQELHSMASTESIHLEKRY